MCVCVYVDVRLAVCLSVCMHVCVHVCMCIYIYTEGATWCKCKGRERDIDRERERERERKRERARARERSNDALRQVSEERIGRPSLYINQDLGSPELPIGYAHAEALVAWWIMRFPPKKEKLRVRAPYIQACIHIYIHSRAVACWQLAALRLISNRVV